MILIQLVKELFPDEYDVMIARALNFSLLFPGTLLVDIIVHSSKQQVGIQVPTLSRL